MRKSDLIRALEDIPGDPEVVDAMDRLVTGCELAEADLGMGPEDVAALVVE